MSWRWNGPIILGSIGSSVFFHWYGFGGWRCWGKRKKPLPTQVWAFDLGPLAVTKIKPYRPYPAWEYEPEPEEIDEILSEQDRSALGFCSHEQPAYLCEVCAIRAAKELNAFYPSPEEPPDKKESAIPQWKVVERILTRWKETVEAPEHHCPVYHTKQFLSDLLTVVTFLKG